MIKKSIEHRAAEQVCCTSHGAATLTHRAHMLHSFRNKARQLKKITQEQVCCIASGRAAKLKHWRRRPAPNRSTHAAMLQSGAPATAKTRSYTGASTLHNSEQLKRITHRRPEADQTEQSKQNKIIHKSKSAA